MASVTVWNGNYNSYLHIDYSFGRSGRTWTFSATLKINIPANYTFGPWQTIGSNSANLRKDGLSRITAGSSATDFDLASYSTSGSYNTEGKASSFNVTWAFNVNSSWGGYANSPNGYITVTPPNIEPANRTVKLYVKKEKIDGTWEGNTWWKDVTVTYGGSYDTTWTATEFQDVRFTESNVTTNHDSIKNAYRKKFYLDLNGFLDKESKSTINGYGTCDVSFNDGTSAQYDITDYYAQHRYGTTYTFANVKPRIGHTYLGVHSGSLTGTVTGETITELAFVTNDVFANCNPNTPGDVYVKENGRWVRASEVYIKKGDEWVPIHG